MNRQNTCRPALVISFLLAGALFVPLIFSGPALAAPLRVNGTVSQTTLDATQSVTFTCTPNGGTLPYSYLWTFGNGMTSTLQNPSNVYNSPGSYIANVTVTDGIGATVSWTSPTITVNPLPSVTGSATPSTIDETQTVSFTCTPSDGTPPFTYLWGFGDGSPGSNSQNPSHTYSTPGSYTADVTATDSVGEQAYWAIVITVNVMSTVTGTATPTTIDATQTVQFTCTPNYGTTPYTYSWVFGDGGTSDLQNPTHMFPLEGLYTSNVTITDAVGGQASWTVGITVNPLPTVTGTATPSVIGSGQIVSFTCAPSSGTAPYTYLWDFENAPGQLMDGTTNRSQSPYYEYENLGVSTGTHNATVTVTDAVGEQATWTTTITVYTVPGVTGTASPAIIDSGQAVSFSCTPSFGSGVYQSYVWSFGDDSANASAGRNVTHIYDAAGTYTATVMVTDSLSARAVWTVDIIVNVLPSVTGIATPSSVDLGDAVSFTCTPVGGTEPYSYSWSFGDGSTSTNQSPDHTYAAIGSYTVNVTITDAANQTANWSVVIAVEARPSGVPLTTVALIIGAIVAALAITFVLMAAKRKKRTANPAKTLQVKEPSVPSVAAPVKPPPIVPAVVKPAPIKPVPSEPAPVKSAPIKPAPAVQPASVKTGSVTETHKDLAKGAAKVTGKVCPLCLDVNETSATVCKRCLTKLK